MRRFAFLRDPLFLICCLLYAVARWALKPNLDIAFVHRWLTDILLIPCAMPPLLWIHRSLRLRSSEAPPTGGEIAAHLFGWSLLFEGIGPYVLNLGTSDPWDVLAYAAGALFAFVWWNRDLFSAWSPKTDEL